MILIMRERERERELLLQKDQNRSQKKKVKYTVAFLGSGSPIIIKELEIGREPFTTFTLA
jgi:hypothetical protein